MTMAMGIVGCAWDARTTMGTSGWSVLPYHQEATQLSSRRCRCLMLCTRICVSKAGQWKVTITTPPRGNPPGPSVQLRVGLARAS